MIIGILIITCIFFIFLSYIFFKRNIMSPTLLLCLGYLIAIISCSMNIDRWDVDLQLNTYIIILLGMFSFFVGEFISQYILNTGIKQDNEVKEKFRYISVSNIKILICLCINILVAILYMKEIIRISGGYGGDFNEMMNIYKRAINSGDDSLKSYVVQAMKFAKGIGYVFLFIFLNNVFYDKKIKKNLKFLIPVLLYLIDTFLMGGRLNMIALAIAALFLYYYNWGKENNWTKSVSTKFIKILCISFIIFLLIFYQSKNIVGRITERSFFDYITEYFGGSIQLLDEYLNSNIKLEKKMETFPGVIQSINKLGITSLETRKGLEFRHIIDGAYLGNIYTGLRRYYNDFGYLGIILIQIIYALIFNNMFIKIKKKNRMTYNNLFRIIFYSYNLFAIVTQAMEDHFFIDLSIGYFIEMIVIYIMIRFIISQKYIDGENKNELKKINC